MTIWWGEMEAIELLLNRASVAPRLHAGAPVAEEAVETILQAAVRAPDHGRLRPWRFLLIRGKARERLGEIFAEALLCRSPDASATMIAREKERPLRSPLIIAVVAHLTPDHPKVPETEQMLSAGTAAYSMVLAAQALGLGAIWVTGANAYDEHVLRALGLGADEKLAGYVYVGSVREDARMIMPKRPDPHDLTAEWEGPA